MMSSLFRAIVLLISINFIISLGHGSHIIRQISKSAPSPSQMKERISLSHKKQRFANPTHPSALQVLSRNGTIFQKMLSNLFDYPIMLETQGPRLLPYLPNTQNAFFEFSQKSPLQSLAEIQFTKTDIWLDTLSQSASNPLPRSDANGDLIVFNLITNPRSAVDRTIVFDIPKEFDKTSTNILKVIQLGLGANRLVQSNIPETQAWLSFLKKAHLVQTIPSQIPDIVAAAYSSMELNNWTQEDRYTPFKTSKKATSEDYIKIIHIIDSCIKKHYPIATMVKYTGLSHKEITKIVTVLKENQ